MDRRPNIDLKFDTSGVDALQEDEQAVQERAREDLKAGDIAVDEFRQRVGEEPLKNELGRSLLLAFNIVPTPVDTPTVTPSQKPTPNEDQPDDDDEEERGYDPAALLIFERDGRRYINRRALSTADLRPQAAIVGAHRGAIIGLAKVVEPHVATYLEEQKQRVIAAMTGVRTRLPTDPPNGQVAGFAERVAPQFSTRALEEIDWQDENDQLMAVLRPWLETVRSTAFAEASDLLDSEIAWDISNPHLADLHELLAKRVVGIGRRRGRTSSG